MSRSGYDYDGDYDNWATIRWAGQLASAIRGKRGQAFLRELIEALDAMPIKGLIKDDLIRVDVEIDPFGGGYIAADAPIVCALGAVGVRRGVKLETLEPDDYEGVAATFGIARQLAAEVAYQNDEVGRHDTPEWRWKRVRDWAAAKLKENWPINAKAKVG